MFSLLKNKKKDVIETDDQDRIAKALVVKFIRLQQQWAAFMQNYFERLSGKWKLIILTLFCLCSGGCSFFLIAKSLTGSHSYTFRLTQFKNLSIGKAGDEKVSADKIVTKEKEKKIQRFRTYMDSLEKGGSR